MIQKNTKSFTVSNGNKVNSANSKVIKSNRKTLCENKDRVDTYIARTEIGTFDTDISQNETYIKNIINDGFSSIEHIQNVITTDQYTMAQDILTLTSKWNDALAQITRLYETFASDYEAYAKALLVLEAKIRGELGEQISSKITVEYEARVTQYEATAKALLDLKSQFDESIAQITNLYQTKATADSAMATLSQSLRATIDDSMANIATKYITKVDSYSALASIETELKASIADSSAKAQELIELYATESSALAKRIESLEASINDGDIMGRISTIEEITVTEDYVSSTVSNEITSQFGQTVATIQSDLGTKATAGEAWTYSQEQLMAELDNKNGDFSKAVIGVSKDTYVSGDQAWSRVEEELISELGGGDGDSVSQAMITNLSTTFVKETEAWSKIETSLISELGGEENDTVSQAIIDNISTTYVKDSEAWSKIEEELISELGGGENDSVSQAMITNLSGTFVDEAGAKSVIENELTAEIENPTKTAIANIATSSVSSVSADDVIAQIETTLSAVGDGSIATVSNLTQATINAKNEAEAKASLILDAGKITGYKATSSSQESDFEIMADNFFISDSTSSYQPFSIDVVNNTISFNGNVSFTNTTGTLSQSRVEGLSTTLSNINTSITNAETNAKTNARDNIALKLGYANYSDMVNKVASYGTVIKDGEINTGLINTTVLFADLAFIQDLTAGTIRADKIVVGDGGYLDTSNIASDSITEVAIISHTRGGVDYQIFENRYEQSYDYYNNPIYPYIANTSIALSETNSNGTMLYGRTSWSNVIYVAPGEKLMVNVNATHYGYYETSSTAYSVFVQLRDIGNLVFVGDPIIDIADEDGFPRSASGSTVYQNNDSVTKQICVHMISKDEFGIHATLPAFYRFTFSAIKFKK
jgi:hypothetical protein